MVPNSLVPLLEDVLGAFVMSMYGTTLCGKYWYLDLLEHLLELGFKACESVHFLFMRVDIGVPLNAVNGPVLVHYLLT